MRKSEVDILYNIEKVASNSTVLGQLPKSPQQRFMMIYAAIYLINKGSMLPIVDKLLVQRTGSASQILLKLKYMKQCMENRVNLDNKDFHVLNTLVLWVQQLKKAQKSQAIKLVESILLPQPHELSFEYYQQFIVYLNYLAVDIQNLFKGKSCKWQPDDLILFLQMALPRIHYNIILPADLLASSSKEQTRDQLFCNLTLQYFTNTRLNYRGLCRLVLSNLINLELKPAQMRLLIDIACRYYLLFWSDSRQEPIELFVSAFSKATEAVRFSLSDELLLFFKICQKLGAVGLQEQLRQKWEWIDSLLKKYKEAVIGHPKEDVNPFNPLSIKEKFSVEAGKSVERVIEIYQDETLFYFMIQVGENDINLKLYYLGDFDSKTEVKKLLHFDEKKSGQNRFAYLASKRGLYMIEFDNSYSWINSKTISFEQVTLLKSNHQQHPPWLVHMYELNNTVVVRQPKPEKTTAPQVVQNQALETIQTHNLQEIYSSEHYEQELVEEEQLDIEGNEFTGNKQHVPSQEKLPTFQEDALDYQPQQSISIQPCKPQNQEVENSSAQPQKQSTSENLHQKEHTVPKTHQKLQDRRPNSIPEETNSPAPFKQETVGEGSINNQQIMERSETNQGALIKEYVNQNKVDTPIQIRPEGKSELKSQLFLGQANLSLIDSIFSLLVSTQGHTYEFETNLQDRIIKRLKSYCQGQQQYQWIVNGEARDWLKKRGFGLVVKGGVYTLLLAHPSTYVKKQSSQKQ